MSLIPPGVIPKCVPEDEGVEVAGADGVDKAADGVDTGADGADAGADGVDAAASGVGGLTEGGVSDMREEKKGEKFVKCKVKGAKIASQKGRR